MKRLLCLMCAVVMLLSGPRAMAFCYEPQPRLVCAEYFDSKSVVKATLLRSHAVYDKDDPEAILAHIYTLKVYEVLHGHAPDEIQLYDGNDSGRVTFDWVQNSDYLLFLIYIPKDHTWAVDNCGNSGPLAKAQRTIAEISAVQSAHGGGAIYGFLMGNNPQDTIADVHIEAVGSKGTFEAVSSKDGKFKIQVPPGEYRLVDKGRKLFFQKYDISYEDPMKIHIESGECAQVQIIGTKSSP